MPRVDDIACIQESDLSSAENGVRLRFRAPAGPGAFPVSDHSHKMRHTLAGPVPGGPVYDVINRDGLLVDRLQIPPGYGLVGFGRGGVVYLSVRGREGTQLARVKLAPR